MRWTNESLLRHSSFVLRPDWGPHERTRSTVLADPTRGRGPRRARAVAAAPGRGGGVSAPRLGEDPDAVLLDAAGRAGSRHSPGTRGRVGVLRRRPGVDCRFPHPPG